MRCRGLVEAAEGVGESQLTIIVAAPSETPVIYA